jgi:aminomethyltransferase
VETLRRTPLYDRHLEAGARIVPFAGWEMPVSYDGVIAEHKAVRSDSGVFDVSHMGELEVEGPTALELLQRLLSNDLSRLEQGDAQYTLLTNETGGIIDDLIVYRTGPCRYLLVVNAANREADFAWLAGHELRGSDVRDVSDEYALLAVQGPRALERLGLERGPAFTWELAAIDGLEVMVNRTGYTGEEGVELACAPEDAPALWDDVLARGVRPCGLGARDTLRLEVCFHLYGNDMDENRNPIEAGLGWCCKERTGFIGSDAVAAAREDGTAEKLVPFAIEGQGIARQGNPVIGGGEVTSGTFSPCLERGIGMAYVSTARAAEGTPIEIDVRGRTRPAIVERKPLYKRERR